MKTINKVALTFGRSVVMLPLDAKPLTAQLVRSTIWLYYTADNSPETQQVGHTFCLLANDSPVSANMEYINTVQLGEYTWHVFKVVR